MRSDAARRRRSLTGLALVLAAVWLAAGLRRVEEDGSAAVLDSPIGILAPRVVRPGWHLVPPFVTRLTRYPLGPATLEIPSGREGGALVTQEGSLVDAGLILRYHVDPGRVLEVHRRFGPRYASDTLQRWGHEALAAAVGGARYADVSGARVEVLREEVGRSLGDRLRQAGFVLLACEVSGLRLLDAPDAGASRSARLPGRILLIGLDGADWNIIDPLLEKGRLPRLDRLIRAGVRGRIRTIAPILSPVLWTSIATGVVPSRHGILDFVANTEREGERVPVTSAQRRVKAFWNMLSESGVRVGVVGWWATWPVEPVDGFMVSDRVAYQVPGARPLEERDRRGKVHPPEADDLVLSVAVAPEAILAGDLLPFMRLGADEASLPPAQARLVEDFRTVLASGRTYVASAVALAARQKTDVTAVYIEGTDTVGHLFMPFAPPPLPGVDPDGRQRFGGTVDAYYAHADELIGRLIDGIRPDTVIVLSDHGFRTGDNRPLTESRIGYGQAADWHRKYGIIVLSGPPFRRGAAFDEASVLDITPTLLRMCGLPVGEDMDGRPIEAAFDPAWTRANPERYVPTWEGAVPGREAPVQGGTVEEAGRGEAGTAAGRGSAPGAGAGATAGAGASSGDIAAGSPDVEGDAERLRKLQELGYLAGRAKGETANAHNNRGTVLLAQGRYDEAIGEFEQAIRAGEDSGIGLLNLARARYKKKDYDGAIATLRDYARGRPRSKEAENLLGNIDMDRNRLQDAEAHFRRALQYEPNFTDARNGLGLLFERQGRHDEALVEFRRVVTVDPDYAEAHNNIGIVLKGQGHRDEAMASFRRAIAADPGFAGAYSNLAILHEEGGEHAAAERFFRESLRRDPANASVRANFGGLLYLTGRLEEAEGELRRAIRDDPRQAAAYNNLGAVYGRLGRPADEIDAYRRAVALDPAAADLRHNLGLALLRSGDVDSGEKEMRRALQLDPRYPSAYLNLARHLVSGGRVDEALVLLREGGARLPGDADIALLLGETALRAGRIEEAVRAYEAALRIRPGDAAIEERLRSARGGARGPSQGDER